MIDVHFMTTIAQGGCKKGGHRVKGTFCQAALPHVEDSTPTVSLSHLPYPQAATDKTFFSDQNLHMSRRPQVGR